MLINHPKLSIHLVTHNGAAWLPYCLESLSRQLSMDFFLLIIDNASLDNSVLIVNDWLRAHAAIVSRTRVIQHKQNLGFARAHNQALAWSQSEYVMLLNQDVILADNYTLDIMKFMDTTAAAAAVTGKIRQWNFIADTFYYESLKDKSEAKIDTVGLKISRGRKVTEINQGQADNNKLLLPQPVFGVSGAAPLYRRQCLEAVSSAGEIFDEDFVSYKEDVDMAWRLRLAGFSAYCVPSAIAYHDRGLAQASDSSASDLINHRSGWPQELRIASLANHWGVLVKNDSWYNWARDWPWIIGFEFKKLAYLLLFEPQVLGGGLRRFFAVLPRFLRKRRLLKTTHRLKPAELRRWW